MTNQTLGKTGEDLAAAYLADKGWEILERNWRCRAGEIDIVAKTRDTVVIVEVKTRTSDRAGHPLEAVTYHKLLTLRRLAVQWVSERHDWIPAFRVDVVGVLITPDGPQISHVENAQ